MAKYSMTKNEKDLLKFAYTDDDRIEDGELFDYQVEALHMIRKCAVYLKARYPMYDLEMISFLPQTKKRPYTEIMFVEKGKDIRYTVRYKMDLELDSFSDNFYDVPFEKEYDKAMEKMLKNKDIKARVYTVFPFLFEKPISSVNELLGHNELPRNTEIFIQVEELPSIDIANTIAKTIEDIYLDKKIKTNGTVYFLKDIEDMGLEISHYDEYVRNRANERNILSLAFRTL